MKKFLVLAMLCVSCFSFTACGVDIKDYKNIKEWGIPAGARFVPVDRYVIDDGSIGGTKFITYVDLDNGTMWFYTEKYTAGYGTTFTKLTDENNNACIYEQLDELRSEYNYKKE